MFAWLWVGVLISGMGTWMQTLGAQWLLLDSPNAAAVVALVQVANTLPVMLLAMPAGVPADSFDKRWLLFAVQVYFLLAGVSLLVLTLAGRCRRRCCWCSRSCSVPGRRCSCPPGRPARRSSCRGQIRSAARLEMVGVNVSRAPGRRSRAGHPPRFGVATVFALNALSVIPLAVALLFWHRRPTGVPGGRERFLPALRAGGRLRVA